jgi:HEAT repeat protein
MTDQVSSSGPVTLASISEILSTGDEPARLAAIRRLAEPPLGSETGADGLAVLVEAMGDDSWQVRKEAVAAALTWSDKTLLADKLVDAMAEPENVGRRNAAIEGVMKLGAITIDPLLRALSEKPEHRKVLVDVLGTFGDTRVVPALASSLLDDDPNVRAAAMEQLASFSAADVGPALEAALDSADLLVVLAALEGLNRNQIALPVTRLGPLLDKVVLRPAVMTSLGQTKDIAALPHLVEGLLDRAKGAREAALVALVRLHEGFTDPQLRKQVESSVSGMSQLALHSTLRALMEATAPVRAATATLLGWSGRRDMVRPLLLVLRDADAGVTEAAAHAIAGMGPVAMEEMCNILPGLDPHTRSIVFSFFQRFGATLVKSVDASVLERLRAVLSKGLSNANPETAEATAKALGALGGDGHGTAPAP